METVFVVTGATGYMGSAICAEAARRGMELRVLVRSASACSRLPHGTELAFGDVTNLASLEAAFAAREGQRVCVIHAAGLISVRKHSKSCRTVNLEGTKNVISACKKCGVAKLVYVSSVDALNKGEAGLVVCEPKSYSAYGLATEYARAKAEASEAVRLAAADGLDTSLVLPSCVLGPGDSKGGFVTQMLRLYLRLGLRVCVRGGYEFVDVRDAAQAIVQAALAGGRGRSYILSSEYQSMTRVFDLIAEKRGTKPVKWVLPAELLYPLVPPAALIWWLRGKELPLSFATVRLLCANTRFSHERARSELGFTPRPLRETVSDMTRDLIQPEA